MTALSFALLGLIARRPQSGYDIAAQLKAPVANFWTARLSQIYPELARLEGDGLVSVEVVPQEGRPAKKIYRLTAAGKRALAEWVVTPPEPSPPRDELLLKTYALPFADPKDAAPMYGERAEAAEKAQLHYESVIAKIVREHGGPPPVGDPAFGQFANLRYGVAAMRERADWCRWLQQTLEGAAAEGSRKKKR